MSENAFKFLQPSGWPRAKGYSNGIVASGQTIYVGGMVGWNEKEQFEARDFAGQFRQVLLNIVAVLKEAGARPEYNASLKEMGAAYREIIGRHYPVMAVLQVSGFIEDGAKLEIEATAVIPDSD